MKVLSLSTLFFISSLIFSQFSLLRVDVTEPDVILQIMDLGISLDHATGRQGVYIEVAVSENEMNDLIAFGIDFEILINDLTAHYQSRFVEIIGREFDFGSMGGYYTFSEIEDKLDEMYAEYPDLVREKNSIGTSIEERDIWAIMISDNPEISEDEPQVLFNALHHAREPQGMMTLFYFAFYLLENYETNSQIRYLVNNREIWLIPCINPDGYVYNETVAPDGGGMHRKNRRPNDDCDGYEIGVDLNRNYGYNWGYNDTGSSPHACFTTYRGTSEFSEPETAALRDFIEDNNLKLSLNYHTYGNLWIHPFGYAEEVYPPEPDLSIFRELGGAMTQMNGYAMGNAMETVGYLANGTTSDWIYGEHEIICFTPEVGSNNDGFWPSTERIIPLAEENLSANIFTAQIAGGHIKFESYLLSNAALPDDATEISIVFQNQGLSETESLQFELFSESDLIDFPDGINDLPPILSRSSYETEGTSLVVSSNAEIGMRLPVAISILINGDTIAQGEFGITIGEEEMVFSDGAENGIDSNWNADGFYTTADAYSGEYGFTESPNGDYDADVNATMTLSQSLDFTNVISAKLRFKAKWDIEENWDFAQVEISTDGITWIPLEGLYTVEGFGQGVQEEGEPGYDGNHIAWITEEISLDDYVENPYISIRFEFKSDTYVTGDGWTIDEVEIWTVSEPDCVLGDINFDGTISVLDIVQLVNLVLGLTEPTEIQWCAADLNSDGAIDVLDVVQVVNEILY